MVACSETIPSYMVLSLIIIHTYALAFMCSVRLLTHSQTIFLYIIIMLNYIIFSILPSERTSIKILPKLSGKHVTTTALY